MPMLKILLFGTGSGADKVWKVLNFEKVNIIAYLDNDSRKVNTYLNNLKIIHPNDLAKVPYFDYIIIASQYIREIRNQLLSLGVRHDKIVAFLDMFHSRNKFFDEILGRQLFSVNKLFKLFFKETNCFKSLIQIYEGEMNQEMEQIDKKGVLFINHLYGGGSQVYQDNIIGKMRKEVRVYTLNVLFNFLIIIDHNGKEKKGYTISFNEINQNIFNGILEYFNIDLLYINQFVSFPKYTLMDLIRGANIDYLFFIHDFYSVCPSFNLINSDGVYCNAETNIATCQKCVSRHLITEDIINFPVSEINIKQWRQKFEDFLTGASAVIAPSLSTLEIVRKYYSKVPIEVIEHRLNIELENTFDERNVDRVRLCIAFIGNINQAKGSKVLFGLYDLIKEKDLPIDIKVIGTTDGHSTSYNSNDKVLEIHGSYEREQVASLLSQYNVSLVIIPILWPETFNYTTSEVMASGYPIITFNLGAPQERIRLYDCGWVLNERTPKAILNLLQQLTEDRNQIKDKARNLKKANLD